MRGTVKTPTRTSFRPGQSDGIPLGRQGELLTGRVHGDYYTLAKSGKLFLASTALAGASLAVAPGTSTAGRFFMHNPMGSGVNVELIEVQAAYVGATTVNPYVLGWEQAIWLDGLPVGLSSALVIQPLGVGMSNSNSGAVTNSRVKWYTSCTNFNNTGVSGFSGAITVGAGIATAAATANVRHAQLGRETKGIMAAPGTITMLYRASATASTVYVSCIWAEWLI